MSVNVLVVINKDGRGLGPSETFLRAHIEGLPCKVFTLIGNPGYRQLDFGDEYLLSRAKIPLGYRWLLRRLGFATVAQQDKWAVSRLVRKYKIDVVLAEYGASAVSVMDACSETLVPLVAHFHGWDAYGEYQINKNSEGYYELFKKAAAVIAVSQHMRNHLLSLGARPETIYHVSCGAEIPAGLKANPVWAGKEFLMVGRLTEKKAPFLSIMAFAKVADIHHDATLNIIGDGPLKDVCIQLCEALKLSAQIVFHGAQSHEVVLTHMAAARCFIQHSVRAPSGDHEGTPVGVLEAMGMGLPVVSTRHGGIMDVIKCGETGTLVDEYDLSGMAQAMLLYADDAALAQKIGESARTAVLENWTSEKSIRRLWVIIEKSIKNHAG